MMPTCSPTAYNNGATPAAGPPGPAPPARPPPRGRLKTITGPCWRCSKKPRRGSGRRNRLLPKSAMLPLAAALLVAYLVGALPFGFLVARAVRGIDIRQHGSGNTGATNVGRVL